MGRIVEGGRSEFYSRMARRAGVRRQSRLLRGGRLGQAPWHFLNFFSLPQGQGSLRPTSFSGLRTGSW